MKQTLIPLVTYQHDGLNRSKLAGKLADALDHRLLDVHYQPQIELESGLCSHFEALVRWRDSSFGYISPSVFIPIAEEEGLIADVTRFVIDRVANDILKWRAHDITVGSIAINISAGHFLWQQDAEQLMSWLKGSLLPPGSIVLELTETAVLQRSNLALDCMLEMRKQGFKLALDDFGTGYSSLSHLLEFPVDAIKIDRSFISALSHSYKGRAMVQSLLDMAHSLEVESIAEGVEHLEEIRLLENWGCSHAQGNFFSKPLPAEAVGQFLARCYQSKIIELHPLQTA